MDFQRQIPDHLFNENGHDARFAVRVLARTVDVRVTENDMIRSRQFDVFFHRMFAYGVGRQKADGVLFVDGQVLRRGV